MLRLHLVAVSLIVVAALPSSADAQAPAPGFRLFGALSNTSVSLLDVNNAVVHQWSTSFSPGLGIRLLADGSLLRAIRTIGPGIGGSGGGIQRIAFNGTLEWDWRYDGPGVLSHHDIAVLPNGNVLMIAWEDKTPTETLAVGRNPAAVPAVFRPEHVIEVQPTGPTSGTIVWEWHVWDHLVQDLDPSLPGFGVVANSPELVNINYPPSVPSSGDWLHMNAIDHDPIHDRIILSTRSNNEIWIIDHSTTKAEAASHSGGAWGRGGDLLYRWGNPAAHDNGTTVNQLLLGQHGANFIREGHPGAGNIILFNNGNGALGSAVWELTPPMDPSGAFLPPVNGVYGPGGPTWSHSEPGFYSQNVSNAERLPNGNTLVCSGAQRWLFEITSAGQRVWEYVHQGPSIFHVRYVDRTLWASATTLSLSAGGTVDFDLVAGTPRASDGHLLLASASGTSPGTPIGSFTLPLNPDETLLFSFSDANGPLLPGTLGTIDVVGRSTAGFTLPTNSPPILTGLELDFAFGTWDTATLAITSASNAVPVMLVQ